MKVYFLRHGETPATEQGLIQGAADFPEINELNENGEKQVRKSARGLIPKIKGARAVYVVQGNQWRVMQSAATLIEELSKEFDANEIYITTDVALKGRSYGKLEGTNEAEARNPKNFLVNPSIPWSYIFAELGFDNALRIQPKKAYEDKVARFVRNLIYYYGPMYEDSAIVIAATSDVFRAMQQGEASKYCYFGDETIDKFGRVTKSKRKIKTGEIVEIEMAKPLEVGYDGKIETIAERKIKENQESKQML